MDDEIRPHLLPRIRIPDSLAEFARECGLPVIVPSLDKALALKDILQQGLTPAALNLILPSQGIRQTVRLAADATSSSPEGLS